MVRVQRKLNQEKATKQSHFQERFLMSTCEEEEKVVNIYTIECFRKESHNY